MRILENSYLIAKIDDSYLMAKILKFNPITIRNWIVLLN